jgi:hypothetical protein
MSQRLGGIWSSGFFGLSRLLNSTDERNQTSCAPDRPSLDHPILTQGSDTLPPFNTTIPRRLALRFDPYPSRLNLPARPLCPSLFGPSARRDLRKRMYMRTKTIIISSLLWALTTSGAIAGPYCAVFAWGTVCDYNDIKECLRAAGRDAACKINQKEDKAHSGTAPYCLVTPHGRECTYDDAPACRMAASINTPAFANKVACEANPNR